MSDIQDFYNEFMQEIYARSGAESDFNEAVFTERMCEFLVEQANIENFAYVGYKKSPIGLRVDAWDYSEDTSTLRLFITDFRSQKDLATLTNTDVTKYLKQAQRFFERSLKRDFFESLEESSPSYGVARDIFERAGRQEIDKVHVFLLSNATLSARVQSVDVDPLDGYDCAYHVWDLGRVFRIESSKQLREDTIVRFDENGNDGLPCLPAFTGTDECESYLLVMPGHLVADLYDRYGERLLEQNVRTFLQFRGNVNKGIRNTIQNEPEMFFSYNNGLSATAESVETTKSRDRITSVTNLQIVNGGQTTAAIFMSTRQKNQRPDISNVYVQVKLSVVPPERVEEVVPRISEYANTQNKVNAADFFSNHPFHLRIEEISRRLWAPSAEGGLQETRWFYERARGQFANAQASLTDAEKRRFLSKYPKSQMFTKTDLAKFENSFAMLPYTVSKGAQKNFAAYAGEIGARWERNEKQFNELFFNRLIAKAVIFRYLDRNIMKQPWYGGYKANIVTYSIAKLVDMVSETGERLDLSKIWRQQDLSDALKAQLLDIAESVNDEIQNTPEGITNVTEWCKKQACWAHVKDLALTLSSAVRSELVGTEETSYREKDAVRTQTIQNSIHAQAHVVEAGAQYWQGLSAWNEETRVLSPKEMGVLAIACNVPSKLPTEKQCAVLVKAEQRAFAEGFVPA